MTDSAAGRKRADGGTDAVFGRVLRAVRESKHISQDELGHRAGYSRNYIGLVEQGKTSPSIRALFNLATAVGVRPSLLIRRAETPIAPTKAKPPADRH